MKSCYLKNLPLQSQNLVLVKEFIFKYKRKVVQKQKLIDTGYENYIKAAVDKPSKLINH